MNKITAVSAQKLVGDFVLRPPSAGGEQNAHPYF